MSSDTTIKININPQNLPVGPPPPQQQHIELSPEQQYAFDEYLARKNLFITGPGGSGKSALIKHIVRDCCLRGKKYQVCALTGCAAVLLGCNAKTLHSVFGLGIAKGDKNSIIEKATKYSKSQKNLKSLDLLIVDEVSMLSTKLFECIDQIARVAKRRNTPFGGIQVIFTGDFYQLPPIIDDDATSQFCFESPLWRAVFHDDCHVQLKRIFRQVDDLYVEILNEMRKGQISSKNAEILGKYVNREYNPADYGGFVPTKLCPTRAKVNSINKEMFDKLDTPIIQFDISVVSDQKTYVDSGMMIPYPIWKECVKLTPEDIEREVERTFDNTNFVKNLQLKLGANVMCVYNVDLSLGICNGAQGVIKSFSRGLPVVKFTNGLELLIERVEIQNEEFPSIVVSQVPLCLAWAMTIHKSQGATLSMAEIDAGRGIFESGQSYVALSRVKSLDGLYLTSFASNKVKANNVVHEFYSKIPELEFEYEEAGAEDIDESVMKINIGNRFSNFEFTG